MNFNKRFGMKEISRKNQMGVLTKVCISHLLKVIEKQ